jgi:hypothetical protein
MPAAGASVPSRWTGANSGRGLATCRVPFKTVGSLIAAREPGVSAAGFGGEAPVKGNSARSEGCGWFGSMPTGRVLGALDNGFGSVARGRAPGTV